MSMRIAIRGAGAAGLSLAQRVLEHDPDARLTLFDQRPRWPHPARTFCYFLDPETPAVVPPTHRWNRVAFAGAGFRRSLSCGDRPYCLTRGKDFFGPVLRRLEQHGVEFHWECREVQAERHQVAWDGRVRSFDVVVDAAFRPERQQAVLWQSFAGAWVTARRAVFTPGEALLMDLQEPGDGIPAEFVYVLPTSPYAALVEHTVFAPQPMPSGWHWARCHAWLARQRITAVSEETREYGAIPLGLREEPVARGGPLRIGSSAGAIRASTGYAFLTIQRQAAELAQRIAAGTALQPDQAERPAYPAWLRLADRLFLQALARAPRRGSEMLGQLLATAPERELLRFLAGRVSPAEALRVMVHVPKRTMVRSLCGGGALAERQTLAERNGVVRRAEWSARRSRVV